MKPDATYIFEKLPDRETCYILREHFGIEIEEFPAVWKRKTHPYFGKKYVCFRETFDQYLKQWFTHSLSLENNRMLTSFNFQSKFPRRAWGDYRNYAILINFNEDWTKLTLLFFKEYGKDSHLIFLNGIAGKLDEMIVADSVLTPPVNN